MADYADFKYETDPGIVCLVKLDKTSQAFAGTEPAGAVDLDIHGIQSKSRRNAGVHVRRAVLSREVGTAPNIFTKYKQVPLLTPARAVAVTALVNTTVSVNGVDWKVSGVSAEVRT